MVGGVMLTALLFELLSGKVEKVLESLKANLSEEAFKYLANNLKKDQISDLMEAVRKLEKELGSTKIKFSETQVKKLLEGLKDDKSVDSMVAELKKLCENKEINVLVKDGLGKISGNEYTVTQAGIDKIKRYLTEQGYIEDYANQAMLSRLEKALANGEK